MKNLFKGLFLTREVRSRSGELHFQRWRLLNVGLFSIYIHRIFKADEDKHEHSHPWPFFGKILKGGYIEERNGRGELRTPGDWFYVSTDQFHKITRLFRTTTTLVLAGPRVAEWGYSVDNSMVPNAEYRELKNAGVFSDEIKRLEPSQKYTHRLFSKGNNYLFKNKVSRACEKHEIDLGILIRSIEDANLSDHIRNVETDKCYARRNPTGWTILALKWSVENLRS